MKCLELILIQFLSIAKVTNFLFKTKKKSIFVLVAILNTKPIMMFLFFTKLIVVNANELSSTKRQLVMSDGMSFPASIVGALQGSDSGGECDKVVEEPTLLVQRFEYANMYHQWTDWLNAHNTHLVLGLPAMRVELFDGHRRSPLDIIWEHAFGMNSTKYTDTTHLDHLYEEKKMHTNEIRFLNFFLKKKKL